MDLDIVVSRHIKKAFEMTGGKAHGESGAARLLNVNPSTLRKRMRKLGIPFGRNAKKKKTVSSAMNSPSQP
jgi:transcriptional regulator with GAF, ATPase, and Fis domain